MEVTDDEDIASHRSAAGRESGLGQEADGARSDRRAVIQNRHPAAVEQN